MSEPRPNETPSNATRYAVVLRDGSRHPAADVATLNAWIAEGRLGRETLLAPEGSNATLAAATVPGLVFPADAPVRSQYESGRSTELRLAWTCAVLAILGGLVPCAGRISAGAGLVGVLLGVAALRRRERGAAWAIAANVLGFALALAWTLLLPRLLGGVELPRGRIPGWPGIRT